MKIEFEGYTRVSSIIGQWNHLAGIDPWVLENKARIGTEVHEKITADLEGIFVEETEEIMGYIKSWMAFSKEDAKEYKNIMTEQRFFCDELKITGQIDGIFENEKGEKFIIDYKTSASAHKKTWFLQAAFYWYLAKKNGLDISDKVIFVNLKKDGKKAKSHEFHCDEKIWKICLAALETFRYFNVDQNV